MCKQTNWPNALGLSQSFLSQTLIKKDTKECANRFMRVAKKRTMTVSHVSPNIKARGRNGEKIYSVTPGLRGTSSVDKNQNDLAAAACLCVSGVIVPCSSLVRT